MSKAVMFILFALLLFTSCSNQSDQKRMTPEQLKERENSYLGKIGLQVAMPFKEIAKPLPYDGFSSEGIIDGDYIRYFESFSTREKKIKSIEVVYISPTFVKENINRRITLGEAIKKHCPKSPELSQYAWIRNTSGRIYGIADVSSSISFFLVDSTDLKSLVSAVLYLESSCPVFGGIEKSDYISSDEIRKLLK